MTCFLWIVTSDPGANPVPIGGTTSVYFATGGLAIGGLATGGLDTGLTAAGLIVGVMCLGRGPSGGGTRGPGPALIPPCIGGLIGNGLRAGPDVGLG